MDRYFDLRSLTVDSPCPPDDWYAARRRDWMFPCGHDKPDAPPDAVIDHRGEDVPLAHVTGASLLCIRADLLDALQPFAGRCLRFGAVRDVKGKLIPELHTVTAERRLRVRGGLKSTRQFCATCGQLLYYPLGKRYVMEQDLTGQPVYLSNIISLVVNQEIADRLRGRKWRKLDFWALPVLTKPQDGLPADLSDVRPSDVAGESS